MCIHSSSQAFAYTLSPPMRPENVKVTAPTDPNKAETYPQEFVKRERVAVFVDAANLFYVASTMGVHIYYEKLLFCQS